MVEERDFVLKTEVVCSETVMGYVNDRRDIYTRVLSLVEVS